MAASKSRNSQTQKSKFIETARALGCDESEEAFAKKLKAIASANPSSNPKNKGKKK